MRDKPQLASAPSELVMPSTARAASSQALARSIRVSGAGSPWSQMSSAGDFAGQLARLGQAAVGVLGHAARHGDGARRQLVQRRGGEVGGGDHGLALADQHAQAEIPAFLALQALQRAQALGVGQRDRIEQHRVGGLRPARLGLGDQIVQEVQVLAVRGHVTGPGKGEGNACPLYRAGRGLGARGGTGFTASPFTVFRAARCAAPGRPAPRP